jgi:hypothetical protein
VFGFVRESNPDGCNELNLVAHGYEDKGRCGGGGPPVVLEMRDMDAG